MTGVVRRLGRLGRFRMGGVDGRSFGRRRGRVRGVGVLGRLIGGCGRSGGGLVRGQGGVGCGPGGFDRVAGGLVGLFLGALEQAAMARAAAEAAMRAVMRMTILQKAVRKV